MYRILHEVKNNSRPGFLRLCHSFGVGHLFRLLFHVVGVNVPHVTQVDPDQTTKKKECWNSKYSLNFIPIENICSLDWYLKDLLQ